MSDSDPDFDAITEKSIYEEAKDRLQIAVADDSDNRKLAKDDALFREGLNHWDNELVTSASDESPELVINFTDTLVNRVVNSIAEREPRGKCHPVGDGADVERADIINGIGRHIEYRSEASVAYDTGVDDSVTKGWGWWELLTEWSAPDSFEKEICIAPIMDCFTVYADPSSIMPTGKDMRWAFVSTKMKRTEYKRLHPKAENAAWNDIGASDRVDWEEREEIRLARYFRITEKSEKLYKIKRQNGETYNRFKSEAPEPEHLAALGDQIVDERDGSRQRVELFVLNGVKVIQREILPGRYIPLIRCQGNARKIDGRTYRRGMVRTLQDPQRMVDYGEVAKIKRLGLTTMSKYIAAEGQIDGHPEWTDSNRTPIPTLVYKPVTVMTSQGEVPLPPPTPIPPAQVEAGFSEFVQGMRSNLLAIAGMPNEPGQDEKGEVVSGKALMRRDKLSDQSHSQYYKNQKLAIAHTWRIMLEWIPVYYSEERMQRIIGEDGKPQMVQLNGKTSGVSEIKNDVTVGRYDVVMDSGQSYETKREEGADNLVNLMSIEALAEIVAKNGADLVFRAIDAPYMEELADRIQAQTPEGLKKVMESLPKAAQAVVQSLSQQIQQLTQQLQAAQLENKYGMAKAHLAATVKAHDVEEGNKTKREDTQSRDETKLKVTAMQVHGKLLDTEIDATGNLLDTHAKAGHESRAQERMIEAGERAEKGNGAGT